MKKEFEIDISDLEKLKGISIARTEDHRAFLVLTYREKTRSERTFDWLFWSAVAALYCLIGFLLLLVVR
jgi:hypothetical protein